MERKHGPFLIWLKGGAVISLIVVVLSLCFLSWAGWCAIRLSDRRDRIQQEVEEKLKEIRSLDQERQSIRTREDKPEGTTSTGTLPLTYSKLLKMQGGNLYLTYDDFGASIWVFGAKATKGEVVVFRITKTTRRPDGKSFAITHDTVCYSPDTHVRKSAVIHNPSSCSTGFYDRNEWFYRFASQSGSIKGSPGSHGASVNSGTFTLDNESLGRTTIKFDVFVMSHAEVKRLHPELPGIEMSGKEWEWSKAKHP